MPPKRSRPSTPTSPGAAGGMKMMQPTYGMPRQGAFLGTQHAQRLFKVGRELRRTMPRRGAYRGFAVLAKALGQRMGG